MAKEYDRSSMLPQVRGVHRPAPAITDTKRSPGPYPRWTMLSSHGYKKAEAFTAEFNVPMPKDKGSEAYLPSENAI